MSTSASSHYLGVLKSWQDQHLRLAVIRTLNVWN